MDDTGPLFILAGNGPYENRGCEAIVRGTVRILRRYYHNPSVLALSFFHSEEQFEKQSAEESDPAIRHIRVFASKRRFDTRWWLLNGSRHLWKRLYGSLLFKEMIPHLDDAAAVLSVGGDNYSLDYGVPEKFTQLDDLVLRSGRPLILWGSSIGPFSQLPMYERFMSHHLKDVTGIFARESATMAYLKYLGVSDNLFSVADPAFLMDATEPRGDKPAFELQEESIGVNLSPLMARYVTGGDLNQWARVSADMLAAIARRTGRPLCLIPHVTSPALNDHSFLQEVLAIAALPEKDAVLVPPGYTAAETKWIIGQMAVFAGARTHATIAALSSGVPTLSFAYSQKARGINRDVFGDERYCLDPSALKPDLVAETIAEMLSDSARISEDLSKRIPVLQERAMDAGSYLQTLLG